MKGKIKTAAVTALVLVAVTAFSACRKPGKAGTSSREQSAVPVPSSSSSATNASSRRSGTLSPGVKAPNLRADEMMQKGRPYSVLFIGSSFSYYNGGVWTRFGEIAEDAGYTVKTDSVTASECALSRFLDPADEYAAELNGKLEENTYDFAFVQDLCVGSIENIAGFNASIDGMTGKLAEKHIKTVLFETWGRHDKCKLMPKGYTMKTMSETVARNYETAGARLGIPVSPVGEAFYVIYNENPDMLYTLYGSDLSHPSHLGTGLEALCHFVTLTGENPKKLTLRGIDPGKENILKSAAYSAAWLRLEPSLRKGG